MAAELTGAKQVLPQNAPSTPVPAANVGGSGNINQTPDNVVTQSAKLDGADAHKDDAHKRQSSQIKSQPYAAPPLEDMTKTVVKTVVGFDMDETNHVYIRIQDSKTGIDLAQIPSKEFVQYLRQHFRELSGSEGSVRTGVSASI